MPGIVHEEVLLEEVLELCGESLPLPTGMVEPYITIGACNS